MAKLIWNLLLTMTVVLSYVYASTTTDTETKIIGGNKTSIGEVPSMVALISEDEFHCGGSLLNQHCALTAAHCVSDRQLPYLHQILVGAYDIDNYEEEPFAEKYPVIKIFIHPNYTDSRSDYDLAIVCTKYQIEYNHYVKPAILPKEKHADFCNNATVYGWGTTTPYNETYPSDLLKVDVPLVSNAECNFKYGKGGLKIPHHQLCYGRGGRDSCSGDSGGPLVCNTGTKSGTQIGIVSFGVVCADPEYLGVYTRVSHFLKWISQTKNEFKNLLVNSAWKM